MLLVDGQAIGSWQTSQLTTGTKFPCGRGNDAAAFTVGRQDVRETFVKIKQPMIRALDHNLSVLISVYNAESTIASEIERLLDAAADSRGTFEMVVVDDASTDHTWEILCELRTLFPQLKVVRNSSRQGLSESLDIASRRASARGKLATAKAGRIVAFDKPASQWSADPTLPIPSVPKPLGQKQLERLASWAGQVAEDVGLWKSPLASATSSGGMQPIMKASDEEQVAPMSAKLNTIRPMGRSGAGSFLDHLRTISFADLSRAYGTAGAVVS